MDTLLVTVTLLSLAVAAALAIQLARLARRERQRSDARVQLLMELAHDGAPEPIHATHGLNDLDLRPQAPAVTSHERLFEEREEPVAWPRRLAAAGALAMIVGASVLMWNMTERAPAAPSTPAAVSQPPLELLTLGHQQQGDTLVITGLVQNPRGAATPLIGVQATVLVFGGDGSLLANGQAPIDFAALAPGEESPFVLRVASGGAVRYRIGFRGPRGETLAHVDRRDPATIARKDTP